MALTSTSPAVQETAESSDIEDDLENVQVPSAVAPGDSFTVDATAIRDRDDVVAVCWKFDESNTCHDAETTHSFEEAGSHTATLIATDDRGNRSSRTHRIVTTTAPTADLTAPESVKTGMEIQLDASDSTDDYAIESYEWDLDGDGTVDETTTSPKLAHTFEKGTHEVTVTAIDKAGQSATATATVDATKDESVQSQGEATDESRGSSSVLIALVALVVGVVGIGMLLVARARE